MKLIKIIKLAISVFMLLFAVLAFAGAMPFDSAVPCIVICSAFVTFVDSKKLESEKRYNEARNVKSAAMLMVMLAMAWVFYKLF